MGVSGGPSIATSSLSVCIDAANPKSTSNGTDIATGHTVTVNGATHETSGQGTIGVWSFDGSNDSLTITNSDLAEEWTRDFSLEVWMRVNTGDTWSNSYRSSILSKGSYAGSLGLWRHSTDYTVSAWARGDSGSKERTVADCGPDEWFHLVYTWDHDSLMAIYKDGALGQSYDPSSYNSGDPDAANWLLGGQSAASGAQGTSYDGYIAVAKIYDRELSAAEVLQNFTATKGRFGK